jgi:ATP-dependent exoDNAse (exonuclease V) alpha subunit
LEKNKNYPLKHLSIRVPWHDNGWNGTVCKNPGFNSSCLNLPRVSETRNDELEQKNAGKYLEELNEDNYPCCVIERATFMSSKDFHKTQEHPYSRFGYKTHSHFSPTTLYFPPYSAPALPFFWMMRDNSSSFAQRYDLDFDLNKEPDLGFPTTWVQELTNQRALLDCFFGHIEEEKSLCFFYAKQVPFYDGPDRIIVGVGTVNKIHQGTEYSYHEGGELKSMLWERMITHSIRPDFRDGFLIPYNQAIEYSQNNTDFDPSEILVKAPDDRKIEFSYATEHVTNDSAIRALNDCKKSLEKAIALGLSGDFYNSIEWIDKKLNELEKLRGSYPGLGAVLSAFGIETGYVVAKAIIDYSSQNNDMQIWDIVDNTFKDPTSVLSDELSKKIPKTLQDSWARLKKSGSKSRIEFLQLLSRFELTHEQASMLYSQEERLKKCKMNCTDEDILENPYIISETTYRSEFPVSSITIDMGMFSSGKSNKELLPKKCNMDDRFDSRRIRAFLFDILESNSDNKGHTLLPASQSLNNIRNLSLNPPCEITGEILNTVDENFGEVIKKIKMENGEKAYQLGRLYDMELLIRETVTRRINGKRHVINKDWLKLIENKFGVLDLNDLNEKKSREEKEAALKEIGESRFSVLIGAAGTGKTTLLSILCSVPEIKNEGILLLAPTGKARVRMETLIKESSISAFTLAQFLTIHKRYDYKNQTYNLSKEKGCETYRTVIIDEASMLTIEMLAALFDCVKAAYRIILVGDPRQLPPIGSGRPFVDIISFLSPENVESIFPKVSKAYAELTYTKRQEGQNRLDLNLANWFRGTPIPPGEDYIWNEILSNKNNNISFVGWNSEEEFEATLASTLIKELKLQDKKDKENFDKSLGANIYNNHSYFNIGVAASAEKWQILSPVRGKSFGVTRINRLIHEYFRKDTIKFARERNFLPKPMGAEEIVYGDKVINLINHKRKHYSREKGTGEGYLANGEIGIVVGQTKSKYMKGKPWLLKMELSSQPGLSYDFKKKDFSDEGDNYLELAYALTVHKSQGSEFNLVILVLPNPCFILSRELIYTALTRQVNKIIILYQGDIFRLKEYASDIYSETFQRMTNIFQPPKIRMIEKKFLEDRLINCASDGEFLRSKSELIIYEKLLERLKNTGFNLKYEKQLIINGVTKYPDFTIEDAGTGKVFYWEHCGMLSDEDYKKNWERKKKWYFDNKILTLEEGEGERGTLIISEDTERGGISVPIIEKLIKDIVSS